MNKELPLISHNLITAFEKKGLFIAESHNIHFPKNIHLPEEWSGVLLATSGTSGERAWVYHPWKTLQEVGTRSSDCRPIVSFLSPAHAAGIETLFQSYFNKRPLKFIPSSWDVSDLIGLEAYTVVSTTPSSLWKLLSYEEGKKLLRETSELKLGGEPLPQSLAHILKTNFPSLKVSIVFGTTETWSIRTEHLGEGEIRFVDELVQTEIINNELWISTPFIATHLVHLNGLIESVPKKWNSQDEVVKSDKGGLNFKHRRGSVVKNAGRKYLSSELEESLLNTFKISWVQVIWDPDLFLGNVPRLVFPEDQIPTGLEAWIKSWYLSAPRIEARKYPYITERGKRE